MPDSTNFDGIYFSPHAEGIEYKYFNFTDSGVQGELPESSNLGKIYNIVLWRCNFENGVDVEVDEPFEAVLVDPSTYIKNLTNNENPYYGCVVVKKSITPEFINLYLISIEESVKVTKKSIETLLEGNIK